MTATDTKKPIGNVWFESLPPGTIVETPNVFYHVAPDGTKSLVCWSSNTHPHAQAALHRKAVADFKRAELAKLKVAN